MAAALPFRGEESKSISLCVSLAWLVQTIPNIISLNIERIRIQLLFFFVDRIVSCSLYNQLFPVSFLIIIMKLAFLQESSLFYPSLICFIDCCICSRFGNYYIPIYIYIYVWKTFVKIISKNYMPIYMWLFTYSWIILVIRYLLSFDLELSTLGENVLCVFFFFFFR